jgi:hypothetical protein
MPPRPLTTFEIPIADAVIIFGLLKQWEFAAYLNTPNGPLIEMRCLMRDDCADPSQNVRSIAETGTQIVVHHNHLSQESLSFPDWNGLATLFDETFAHCADGTRYWGRVLNRPCVEKVIHCAAQTVEMNAENHLFSTLNNVPNQANHPMTPAFLAHFFRKEVVNRAMRLRKFVDYEYSWGMQNIIPYFRPGQTAPGPVGILGTVLEVYIDQAANVLAPTL